MLSMLPDACTVVIRYASSGYLKVGIVSHGDSGAGASGPVICNNSAPHPEYAASDTDASAVSFRIVA